MSTLNEGDVEAVALEWLRELGWGTAHGSGIGPEAGRVERGDYSSGEVTEHPGRRDLDSQLGWCIGAVDTA